MLCMRFFYVLKDKMEHDWTNSSDVIKRLKCHLLLGFDALWDQLATVPQRGWQMAKCCSPSSSAFENLDANIAFSVLEHLALHLLLILAYLFPSIPGLKSGVESETLLIERVSRHCREDQSGNGFAGCKARQAVC